MFYTLLETVNNSFWTHSKVVLLEHDQELCCSPEMMEVTLDIEFSVDNNVLIGQQPET